MQGSVSFFGGHLYSWIWQYYGGKRGVWFGWFLLLRTPNLRSKETQLCPLTSKNTLSNKLRKASNKLTRLHLDHGLCLGLRSLLWRSHSNQDSTKEKRSFSYLASCLAFNSPLGVELYVVLWLAGLNFGRKHTSSFIDSLGDPLLRRPSDEVRQVLI